MSYFLPTFQNQYLFLQALTHKSFEKDPQKHNERLEFLGDSVLYLSVAEYLMKKYPDLEEGDLSRRRTRLICTGTLAGLAIKLNLQNLIRLGPSEKRVGSVSENILAGAFEAIVGGIYQDQGWSKTNNWLHGVYDSYLQEQDEEAFWGLDYKTTLQEWVQAQRQITPSYSLIKEEKRGVEHWFLSAVVIGGQEVAQGWGKSRKKSEQEAAKAALERFSSLVNSKKGVDD